MPPPLLAGPGRLSAQRRSPSACLGVLRSTGLASELKVVSTGFDFQRFRLIPASGGLALQIDLGVGGPRRNWPRRWWLTGTRRGQRHVPAAGTRRHPAVVGTAGCSRSLNLWILPVAVLGSSSTKWKSRGHLKCASCSRTC